MKHALLLMIVFIAGVMPAKAQTATELNEGLQVTAGTTAGDLTVSWWGKAGRTYFIQQSFDLMTWTYAPVIESGAEAVCGLNIACADFRQFWRLRYTDEPTGGNAETADFDGDGASNEEELAAGIDPFDSDTDDDFFRDGDELAYNSDPASGSSVPSLDTSEPEKEPNESAISLVGYAKVASNNWGRNQAPGQPEQASGYVSWYDDDGHAGTESYSVFESRWGAKFELLSYPEQQPEPESEPLNYGYLMNAGAYLWESSPNPGETYANGVLSHLYARIGSSNGLPLPRPAYRKLLSFQSSRPWDGSVHTYSALKYEKFYISQDKTVSLKNLLLEPEMTMGMVNEQELQFFDLYMSDWSLSESFDTISHTETGMPTPWMMLPAGKTCEIGVWHNAGSVATFFLKPAGGDIVPAATFEVDASTPFVVSSGTVGDTGFLRVGVGNPGDTAPLLTPDTQDDMDADYQHVLRFTVKEEKELLVMVHPICLATLDGNGVIQPGPAPQHLPSEEEIENYLNSIFHVQANIHVTVEMRNVAQLRWDIGVGADCVPGNPSLGAGDGRLSCFWGKGTKTQWNSAEEKFILDNELPDAAAGINLYYIVAPGNVGDYSGWMSTEAQTEGTIESLSGGSFIGWAGPAVAGHASRAVFVIDHAANSTDAAGVLWTMAHEIGHGVGKLPHTCGAGLEYWSNPNHMRGSDNESRLMTGRYGPKRAAGPMRMIKWEWDQLNQSPNVKKR